MPDSTDAEGASRASGWYPDPETPRVLRWWDGTAWSETDTRVAGEEGYPLWHPEFYRQFIRSAAQAVVIKIAARTWWR